MRKKFRFHSLKRVKVRQDWSKWTLYNLSRLTTPPTFSKTYFQQKWAAKSATRAYHGEQIREKQWKRMFKRHIPAVVPMDHKYLARHDGSEQAAGRGSGADTQGKERKMPSTPYMMMTYYPIERRLDTAIFRALFASSTRQARQFVVHGRVKVNGKKMIYPGYLLNPGDMFQVEPDSVLFATGARKVTTTTSRRTARRRAKLPKEKQISHLKKAEPVPLLSESNQISSAVAPTATSSTSAHTPDPEALKRRLTTLMEKTKAALEDDTDAKAKDKQKLRELKKAVRSAISVWKTSTASNTQTLEDQLAFIKSRYALPTSSSALSNPSLTRDETSQLDSAISLLKTEEEQERYDRLKAEAEEADANPVDHEKPYATPWRPRDYMSVFAFIPRYLEVNQNVCAAVYLRHPVARPGLAEVPSPFHYETSQLAFNWYLKRR